MTALAFALSLASATAPPPSPPSWWGGRVLTTQTLHIGIRPAFYMDNEANGGIEVGAGVTVQITTVVL